MGDHNRFIPHFNDVKEGVKNRIFLFKMGIAYHKTCAIMI